LYAAFYVVLCVAVYAQHQYLPEVKTDGDTEPTVFSEERAWIHIEEITGLGVRTVGSDANEKLTPAYIVDAIRDAAKGAPFEDRVDIDIQRPSGSFHIDFISGFTNAYQDVTNVVVRLRSPRESDDDYDDIPSILINSHFDSALGTVAASDDVVQVAVMIEVFRSLVWSETRPLHDCDVIFLFNGAEETILQGSHGFVTQHPYASSVRAMINLEAAGSGGREVLFQTGPGESWIALAYAQNVPYPHGSSLYQDAFQTGLIPSDTDFSIFRDFGGLVGVDLAFVEDGWAYHTHQDDAARLRLRPGSVQRCGENVLQIVRGLSSAPEFRTTLSTDTGGKVVFFDILGVRMVVVRFVWIRFATILVLLLLYVWIVRLKRFTKDEMVFSLSNFGKRLVSALAAPFVVSVVLCFVAPLCWYARPALVIPLFVAPSLAVTLRASEGRMVSTEDESKKRVRYCDDARSEEIAWTGAMCFWTTLAVLSTLAELGSSYLLVLWPICSLLARVSADVAITRWARRARAVSVVLGTAFPLLLTSQLLAFAYDFFVPLAGRSGTDVSGDVIVALLTGLSVFLFTNTTAPLFVYYLHGNGVTRKLQTYILAIAGLGVLYATCCVSPYTSMRPKRMYVQHVRRRFFDIDGTAYAQDSGLWLNAIDFTALRPLRRLRGVNAAMPQLENDVEVMSCDQDTSIYCDLPWYLPIKDMVRNGLYVKVDPPALDAAKGASFGYTMVEEDADLDNGRRKIRFHATGAHHMIFYFKGPPPDDSGDEDGRLLAWSLTDGTPKHSGTARPDGDLDYFVFFASGAKEDPTFDFWVEFSGGGTIEAAAAGHYVDTRTPEVIRLTSNLPDWITYVGWVSLWERKRV